jgi:hypothetical protein
MIFMCLELEKIERKSFQFFPIQTNAIPRHIQVDTKELVELFVETNKHQKLLDVWITEEKLIDKGKNQGKPKNKTKADLYYCLEQNKEFIWNTFFNITQTRNNYVFDYTIITDGYATSLRFLHKDFINDQNSKKEKIKAGKKALQGLEKEEKEKIKENTNPIKVSNRFFYRELSNVRQAQDFLFKKMDRVHLHHLERIINFL